MGRGGVAAGRSGGAGAGTSEGRARARRASAGPAQGGSLARPRIGDAARSGIAPRGGGGPQRADDRGDGAGGPRARRSPFARGAVRGTLATAPTGPRQALLPR